MSDRSPSAGATSIRSLAKAEGLWKMLPECRADRESAKAWRISSVRPGGRFVRLSSKQRRYLVAKGDRL